MKYLISYLVIFIAGMAFFLLSSCTRPVENYVGRCFSISDVGFVKVLKQDKDGNVLMEILDYSHVIVIGKAHGDMSDKELSCELIEEANRRNKK